MARNERRDESVKHDGIRKNQVHSARDPFPIQHHLLEFGRIKKLVLERAEGSKFLVAPLLRE